MRRGLTLVEFLIIIAVIVLFFLITVPIYLRAQSKSLSSIDEGRMRSVYVALSVYESENQEAPAPSLVAVRSQLADDTLLLSQEDPFSNYRSKSFPVDPELPGLPEKSPVRISFSYLNNFIRTRIEPNTSWQAERLNSLTGVLSSGWSGQVDLTVEPFTARLYGPVLRINMDGALFRAPNRRSGRMGDYKALFYNR